MPMRRSVPALRSHAGWVRTRAVLRRPLWTTVPSSCGRRSRRQFWCERLGTYALALDGAGRRCEVRSSNAGQLLMTGIVSLERARRVASGMMDPIFLHGVGHSHAGLQ